MTAIGVSYRAVPVTLVVSRGDQCGCALVEAALICCSSSLLGSLMHGESVRCLYESSLCVVWTNATVLGGAMNCAGWGLNSAVRFGVVVQL
jgi:hypothetical protein